MKAHFQTFRSLLALLIASAATLCAPSQSQSSPASFPADPAVTVTSKQTAAFEPALQAVASQAHVTVLAEGLPLHWQQPAVKLRSLPLRSPASAAMEALAEDYDYAVQRQGNIVIFLKRYSDKNDLPDVPLEECDEALRDIVTVLKALSPGPPRDQDFGGPSLNPQLVGIAATLTPDQFQAMKQQTADKGLSIASLSDATRSQIHYFVLVNYVRDVMDEVQGARSRLSQACKAGLYVKRSTQVGTRTIQIGNDAPVTQTITQNTSFGFNVYDGIGRVSFDPLDENAAFTASASDQMPAPPAAPPMPVGSGDGYTTLGAVAKALNARGTRVTVARVLVEKTMTLYRADSIDPEKLLKAISTLYGLRYFKEEDGRKQLTRPDISVPLTVAALPDAVRRVLPAPLLRALHDGGAAKGYQAEAALTAPPPSDLVKWQRQQSEREKKFREWFFLPGALHYIAVADLRAAYDAQLAKTNTTVKKELAQKQSTPPIPMSAFPMPARSALALALMTDFLDHVANQMGQQAPDWAANPDACYLTGGLQADPARPGIQIFVMGISKADAEGRLVCGITTSTDYSP